jgi:hypothetical protein
MLGPVLDDLLTLTSWLWPWCRGYLPMFQNGGTQDLIKALLTSYCLNTGMK